MTQSMAFSPYKKPFEERLVRWEAQLSLVSEVIDAWLALQRAWMYLEPIFSSPDILQQLPQEGKKYSSVDRIWRKVPTVTYSMLMTSPCSLCLLKWTHIFFLCMPTLSHPLCCKSTAVTLYFRGGHNTDYNGCGTQTMQAAKASPGILKTCASQKLLDQLNECNKLLESVQKVMPLLRDSDCQALDDGIRCVRCDTEGTAFTSHCSALTCSICVCKTRVTQVCLFRDCLTTWRPNAWHLLASSSCPMMSCCKS